jgi:signal transduction histidine kinase
VLVILAQQIGLAIYNAQLFEEIQRANAAKTKFISYVSHELRNGVGNVIGLADGMLHDPIEYDGQPLPPPYQEDMRTILQTGRHLKALLTDIVNWGQIESGRMKMTFQAIDSVSILSEVVRASAGSVHVGVALRTCYPSVLPPVRADATRLKQVLSNLVGNAAKFTVSGAITLDARIDEPFLCFSVADTGKGMTREEQSRLFQAYAQASDQTFRDYGGNGLGLHISEQIIRLHGGRIWLESQPGVGTTFYFTIPLFASRSELEEPGVSRRT